MLSAVDGGGGANGALVLIVDDEDDVRLLLEANLRRAGYRTICAATGREALVRVGADGPDLVLLDLGLPDLHGTEVCRILKSDSATARTPVIMLSASAAVADRIEGLERGADDYVTKPFNLRELILRLEVACRRRNERVAARPPERFLRLGGLEIDREGLRARLDGHDLKLTSVELKLLTYLADGDGRVRRREDLLVEVWGISPEARTRTVETHVKRLRAKLGAFGERVETVRMIGYRLRVE